MAVVQHQTANQTVATIAERNDPNIIPHKRDGMIVTVSDAIADPDAGPGAAIYIWNKTLNKWLLMSKSTTETMSFQTVELTIADGKVAPPNIPSNNVLWDIYILETQAPNAGVILAEIRLENIIVSSTLISGLGAWNGKKLRFTYAFGTLTQQMSTYIDDQLTVVNKNITNVTNVVVNTIGTIAEFEGALNG